jgi:hypothetical protein
VRDSALVVARFSHSRADINLRVASEHPMQLLAKHFKCAQRGRARASRPCSAFNSFMRNATLGFLRR